MKIKSNSTMGFEVYLTLSEAEARALEEITAYGIDSFMDMFYKGSTESSKNKHRDGMTSLFDSIKSEIPKHLNRIDNARKVFQEQNPSKG